MQTSAPQDPRVQVLPQKPQHPRLYQMLPGMLFRAAPAEAGTPSDLPLAASRGVLALLTHGYSAVTDNTRIWCAVICADPSEGIPGEFIGLPRDTPVERLHVLSPMQLASAH